MAIDWTPIIEANQAKRWSLAPEPDRFLDLFPGAVFSWGLRKLRKNQQYCFRLQRTSDSQVLDIGFIGEDLDTQAIIDFCGGSPGIIYKIYGQTGLSPGIEDLILSSVEYGIIYDGTNLILNDNGNIAFKSPTSAGYNYQIEGTINWDKVISNDLETSLFFVTQANIAGERGDVFFTDNGDTQRINLHSPWTSGNYIFDSGATANRRINVTQTNQYIAYQQSWIASKTALNLRRNSVNVGSLSVASDTRLSGSFQTSPVAFYTNTYNTELTVYPTDKTPDLAAIEANIQTYWNL